MHQKPPLFAHPLPVLLRLWSVKIRYKNKTSLLQEHSAALCLVNCIDWEAAPVAANYMNLWGAANTLHHLWHLVLEWNPLSVFPRVSQFEFRPSLLCGRDEDLIEAEVLTLGGSDRPLCPSDRSRFIIRPPLIFAVGGLSLAADVLWWLQRDHWRRSQHVGASSSGSQEGGSEGLIGSNWLIW